MTEQSLLKNHSTFEKSVVAQGTNFNSKVSKIKQGTFTLKYISYVLKALEDDTEDLNAKDTDTYYQLV